MKKFFILLSIIAMGTACGDFLEPKSQSEYIPRSADALNETLLGSAYTRVEVQADDMLGFLAIFDDDIMCTTIEGELNEAQASSFISLQALFTWQPDAWFVVREFGGINQGSSYQVHYALIRGANAVLDYIDTVTGTENEKNNVKAQALALRAFYYFNLVNIWGAPYNYDKTALGVPLKTTSALEARSLPRNTVEEVYTQIVEDLIEAERLYKSLPVAWQYRRDYRTNLPMVQLLLSRVYLYMEQWTNAAIYALEVINNDNFSLLDLNTLNVAANGYYNFANPNSPEAIWRFGNVNSLTYWTNHFTILRRSASGQSISNGFPRFFNASDDLLNTYEPGDLRRENYIVVERYRMDNATRDGGNLAFGKVAIQRNAQGIFSPMTGGSFAYSFRLSEAYLNLAEAAACLGTDPGTALWALNTLRLNRFTVADYVEISGVSGQDLIDLVRLERRRELCFEGHRWFDLRRQGMPSFTREWRDMDGGTTLSYTLNENDPFYTLPFAPNVMELNTALLQNPLPEVRPAN
ncbi:MAG: RagB/SusD family nutrient uptake outer membrane protein [Rikenellaceae bacterium]|nr:RagB/SusD family nutrient uptake outer membrane protein [Rikenellaceae bacterium]MCL2693126.1 RagB/SusD family nutrient uptake outer membrane protein [Rikenellaceae bacterium]